MISRKLRQSLHPSIYVPFDQIGAVSFLNLALAAVILVMVSVSGLSAYIPSREIMHLDGQGIE